MNQEIHWGKIVVLVIAIVGIASIAFVAGRKGAGVSVSEKQEMQLSGNRSSSVTGGSDDQQKEESNETTVRYENKKYGFSMEIPVSWTKIEENDARGDSIEVSFSTEEGGNSTVRLTLAAIPPETFDKTIRLCSLWTKYQYGVDGASKNELADAQLCQSLGYKTFTNNFIARNKSYYFALGRWSSSTDLDDTAQAAVDSFKILGSWIQWKKYRNEKYGFEFQYPDTFFPSSSFEEISMLKTEDGNTYDVISLQFTTRDASFRGSYSPFNVTVYSTEKFQKMKKYCQSENAQPLDCALFPITDEEDKAYNIQHNNKYVIYMRGTWWQDSAPVDWMTPTELGWTLDTFKVFNVK